MSQVHFFIAVHLLPVPKDLRFDHGGAKLASCPGRHLTSFCPWSRPIPLEPLCRRNHDNHCTSCFVGKTWRVDSIPS